MKKRTIGTREDHISYLNENKKMDRSLMAFNLQNQFGLKKREAADLIREWYYTEEKEKVEADSEDEEESDEKDKWMKRNLQKDDYDKVKGN